MSLTRVLDKAERQYRACVERVSARNKKIKHLEKELRDARKAVRIAKTADWMVTCDWTDGDERDAMWDRVKKLVGIKRWSYRTKS